MKHTRKTLPLDDIRIDGGTQARVGISEETVAEYAEHPDGLPPLVVFDDGSVKWLADGFHRYHARRKAGLETVECEVYDGSKEEALWYAVGANQQHGLRRTAADRRHATEIALKHRSDLSDRAIAEHVGVSPTTVGVLRTQLSTLDSSKNGEAKRTGRDGKKRSAPRRPKPPPDPADDTTDPVPEPLRDPFGLPVPPEMVDVFDPALEEKRREVLSTLKHLFSLVSDYASSPAGAYIRPELRRQGKSDEEVRYVDQGLVEARRRFEQLAPHCSVCPYCFAKAGKTRKDCNACKGLGWVPAQIVDKNGGTPKDYIEAVEALKEGGEQ